MEERVKKQEFGLVKKKLQNTKKLKKLVDII